MLISFQLSLNYIGINIFNSMNSHCMQIIQMVEKKYIAVCNVFCNLQMYTNTSLPNAISMVYLSYDIILNQTYN